MTMLFSTQAILTATQVKWKLTNNIHCWKIKIMSCHRSTSHNYTSQSILLYYRIIDTRETNIDPLQSSFKTCERIQYAITCKTRLAFNRNLQLTCTTTAFELCKMVIVIFHTPAFSSDYS